jgi:hypothetical protein
MAKMLRDHPRNYGDFGCCDHCARKKALHLKPGPRERHVARAREKRQWKREEQA